LLLKDWQRDPGAADRTKEINLEYTPQVFQRYLLKSAKHCHAMVIDPGINPPKRFQGPLPEPLNGSEIGHIRWHRQSTPAELFTFRCQLPEQPRSRWHQTQQRQAPSRDQYHSTRR
jgi:hypothetical protein